MVVFPLLGVGDFTGLGLETRGPVANSRFVPDEIINPHPRFATLTQNIRKRRGKWLARARAPRSVRPPRARWTLALCQGRALLKHGLGIAAAPALRHTAAVALS